MAEAQSFKLHEIVKDIASGLELVEGKMIMSDGELAKSRARLLKIKEADKKDVLVSLVALASRLVREGKEGATQATERLVDLAAALIGDGDKARAIFTQAGAVHGLKPAKPKKRK